MILKLVKGVHMSDTSISQKEVELKPFEICEFSCQVLGRNFF